MEQSGFWAVWGKISAVLATIATCIGIWVSLNPGGEDLELHISSHQYALSPDISNSIKSNFKNFSYPELRNAIDEEFNDDRKVSRAVESFIERYHEKSWKGLSKYEIHKYSGFSYIVITNTGDRTASEIRIDFPSNGIVVEVEQDDTRTIKKFNKVIEVEDIRAGTSTVFGVWSEDRVRGYDLESINLTHKNGKGTVSWDIVASGYVEFLGKYPYFILPVLFVVFILGGILGSSSSSSKCEDSQETEYEK
ncbi:TPA: hypothetical protein ACOJP0_004939 [Vibrio harveyi]|uniref:hypothetical protein n=1 Tax=Vibrio harveyi TaxID=669 RepID=UPI00390985B3